MIDQSTVVILKSWILLSVRLTLKDRGNKLYQTWDFGVISMGAFQVIDDVEYVLYFLICVCEKFCPLERHPMSGFKFWVDSISDSVLYRASFIGSGSGPKGRRLCIDRSYLRARKFE